MIKWALRIVVLGILAAVAALVLHRRQIVGTMEQATETVDDRLKDFEKKGRRLERQKDAAVDLAHEVKDTVTP